jgi:hypothetical protein
MMLRDFNMQKSKIFYSFLMLSIPLNFIVVSGPANLYLSTLLIFIVYCSLVVYMLKKDKIHLYIISIYFYLLLITLFSYLVNQDINIKLVGIGVIKYFQLFAILSVSYDLAKYIKFDYLMKFFLIVIFLASIRYISDNINTLFLFSVVSGERPNPEFIGSFNNFAMLVGIAILITIYEIKNILYRSLLLVYWSVIVLTTLSRGTVVSLLVTFLFFLVIKKSFKYYLKVLIYSLLSLIMITYTLEYLGYLDIVINLLDNRYFSFLEGKSLDSYGSGRVEILNDIFYNHFLASNLFELLFGHGFGSIHFYVNPTFLYDTTHNNFIDLLYKNGLIFSLFYIIYLCFLLLKLLQKRINKNIQLLIAILIYYNFSILMNPILFAIQVNWIYTLFLGITIYTIKNNHSIKNSLNKDNI